jgi:hypothetical protein
VARPPRIALVVACSQRKRAVPPAELRLSSIGGEPDERATEWSRRVRVVDADSYLATDLYAGEHWQAAREAYRLTLRYSSRAEFWIVSAGYGLITDGKPIKPYSATFASGVPDSVWRGSIDGGRRSCLEEWWRRLPHDVRLTDLVVGGAMIVVAAGASYVTALDSDLAVACREDDTGERLSVISAGSREAPGLLPGDTHRHVLGGVAASFNARLLLLLAESAASHQFRRTRLVRHLLRSAGQKPRSTSVRRHVAVDTEVLDQIARIREFSPDISRTDALRRVRSAGIACGQERFAFLWRRMLAEDAST